MFICKFCTKECKNDNSHRNHERQCPHNATRVYKNGMLGKTAWNKGLTSDSDIRVAELNAKVATTKKLNPIKMSDEQKAHLSRYAKAHGYGGYKENAGRSKKFKVYDSFGKLTTLQSTYEYACFELLCELELRWIRPPALKYDSRNYFADFYLIDFNVWLDPKNNYKALQDANKIQKVIEQNNVRLFVLLKEQITKQYINSLLSNSEAE